SYFSTIYLHDALPISLGFLGIDFAEVLRAAGENLAALNERFDIALGELRRFVKRRGALLVSVAGAVLELTESLIDRLGEIGVGGCHDLFLQLGNGGSSCETRRCCLGRLGARRSGRRLA